MSAITEHSFLVALLSAARPLTAVELSIYTKTSLATVYRVTAASDKIEQLDTRPVRFYATKYAELDTNRILVDVQRPAESWLEWSKNAKTNIIPLLDINDPKKKSRELKAQALRGYGTLLISLSNELMHTLDRPDWHERLEEKG